MTRSKRGPGLADDVTFTADSDGRYGRARAVDRPLRGAAAVARFLLSYHDGRLLSVLRLGVVEGRVQGIHVHADPDRLAGLGGVRFAN